MRSWLQDPDGDGTYTFTTDQIPAGNYEFKVAHGLGWDENYGAGGAPGGANVAFSVPVRRRPDDHHLQVLSTHAVSVKTSKAGAAPDLTKSKAYVVGPDLVAWPASALPAGTDPATLSWRLHWSADGGLARRRRGGHRRLRGEPDPRPRRAARLAAWPPTPSSPGPWPCVSTRRRRAQLPEILKGQVAVAMYDSTGQLLDATGAQTAIALDALYAAVGAPTRSYGVSFTRRPGRLQPVGADRPAGHPADLAGRLGRPARSTRPGARR